MPDEINGLDGGVAQRTFVERPWVPIDAPVRSELGARSGTQYEAVLAQFEVERNPRYRPRDGKTYCNIFVWDVTSAMNVEIPHWTTDDGRPALPTTAGAARRNVNAMYEWLQNIGSADGWRQVTAHEAQECANRGEPAVAIWRNPSGSNGHIAMIRPGLIGEKGPAAAQAGNVCFIHGQVADGFPDHQPEYWTHS